MPLDGTPERACPKCSRPMRLHGRARGEKPARFLCRPCGLTVSEGRDPSDFSARPHCVKCRRFMWRQLQAGGFRFRCPGCQASCYESETNRARVLNLGKRNPDGGNPCCLKCRRLMRSGGVRCWRCYGCGVSTRKRVVGAVVVNGALCHGKRPTRPRLPGQPTQRTCRRCFRPMRVAGYTRRGRRTFQCRACPYSPTKLRDGATLLAFASSRFRSPLPAGIREEAAHALAADLLEGKVHPLFITPAVARRYVRAAYGLTDAKKFSSLDAPTRGNSTLAAVLEEGRRRDRRRVAPAPACA